LPEADSSSAEVEAQHAAPAEAVRYAPPERALEPMAELPLAALREQSFLPRRAACPASLLAGCAWAALGPSELADAEYSVPEAD